MDAEDAALHGLASRPPSRIDTRPDGEIATALGTYIPVTSERNFWMFWDKGFAAMPPWIQRSVINCYRREGKQWTIRLLDTVPGSPNHVLNYTEEDDFPLAVTEARMTGNDASQKTSNFARLAVVYRHGGIYMDAGTLLLRDLDDICWAAISDPSSPHRVAFMAQQLGEYFGQILNCFIAARKHDPFIHRWQQIYLHMWKGRDNTIGLHAHPLVAHLPLLRINSPSFSADVDWVGFTDYLAQVQAFERVRLNQEPGEDGFDGPAYFRNNFYLLNAGTELFRGQAYGGADRVLQLLLLPRTGSSSDADQADASRFVHDILARSSCCKFSYGTVRLGLQKLVAKQWSLPEHANDDCQPGTWGEYLRHGSVNFHQTRDLGPLPIPSETGRVTNVGLFEPVVV